MIDYKEPGFLSTASSVLCWLWTCWFLVCVLNVAFGRGQCSNRRVLMFACKKSCSCPFAHEKIYLPCWCSCETLAFMNSQDEESRIKNTSTQILSWSESTSLQARLYHLAYLAWKLDPKIDHPKFGTSVSPQQSDAAGGQSGSCEQQATLAPKMFPLD